MTLAALNAKLRQVEIQLIDSDGLYRRPWYRHLVYAPGYYTGYGVKTMPGVRESIEQKQWTLAQEQIVRLGKVLENAGEATLDRATAAP